jgi:hypothetical protein
MAGTKLQLYLFWNVLTIIFSIFSDFGLKFVVISLTTIKLTKMRKILLSLAILSLSGGVLLAQGKKNKKAKASAATETSALSTTAPATPTAPAVPTLNADDMVFEEMTHDFGTIPEGPDAATVFSFKNNGKEPLIIQKAQPSCGCTVPSFSGEPVTPGAKGTINVAYHSKGKPGQFTKTISVVSNAGTKVLTIKGNVEKAPASSVPENNSMMRTN